MRPLLTDFEDEEVWEIDPQNNSIYLSHNENNNSKSDDRISQISNKIHKKMKLKETYA